MANRKVKRDTAAPKSKPRKTRYRVKNWAEYDRALKKRGSLTLWLSDEVIEAWKYQGPQKRGGQKKYSDLAILTALSIRTLFSLGLRQTEGFLESLVKMLNLSLNIPDHTTISRRQKKLTIKLGSQRLKGGARAVVVDSTGLKVYGEGEWKVRQHGVGKRRTWRKLHLTVDPESGEVLAVTLTENGVDDASQVEPMLNQIEDPIGSAAGDGAYDKAKVYEAFRKRSQAQGLSTDILIPPRKDAKIWQHGNCKGPPHPRDENLRYIRRHGRKKWKKDKNFHRRSLVETAMFRQKRLFGDTLKNRTFENQKTEAALRCMIMNRLTSLGMPESIKVSA